jgi:hypothetical protein
VGPTCQATSSSSSSGRKFHPRQRDPPSSILVNPCLIQHPVRGYLIPTPPSASSPNSVAEPSQFVIGAQLIRRQVSTNPATPGDTAARFWHYPSPLTLAHLMTFFPIDLTQGIDVAIHSRSSPTPSHIRPPLLVAPGYNQAHRPRPRVHRNTPHLVDHFPATRTHQRAIAVDRLAATSPPVAGNLTLGKNLSQIYLWPLDLDPEA